MNEIPIRAYENFIRQKICWNRIKMYLFMNSVLLRILLNFSKCLLNLLSIGPMSLFCSIILKSQTFFQHRGCRGTWKKTWKPYLSLVFHLHQKNWINNLLHPYDKKQKKNHLQLWMELPPSQKSLKMVSVCSNFKINLIFFFFAASFDQGLFLISFYYTTCRKSNIKVTLSEFFN